MRKMLCTVLLVFLSVSVQAADYADSLRSARVAMRRTLGLDTVATGLCSDEAGNFFWRAAVTHVVPVLAVIQVDTSIATVLEKKDYAFDTTLIKITSVFWSRGDSGKYLQYLSQDKWFELLTDASNPQTEGKEARPQVYDYSRGVLYLHPTPNIASDTIRIRGSRRVSAIGASSSFAVIPQEFREPIVLYASYRLAKSRNLPIAEDLKRDYIEALKLVGASDASVTASVPR